MIDIQPHFSRAARAMQASAIRKAGDLEASRPDLISLAPGFPDPALFAWEDLREAAASLLSGRDGSVLQYGRTRGHGPLLHALGSILGARGIRASAEETIVTTGSQQALDLCARILVDPGDAVLVELPAYSGAITAFGNAQARLVGVRQDGDGIDIADLAAVAARERSAGRRAGVVYVVPNFQNPTGLLMSLERRRELLDWARRSDALIVEDDPYGALHFDDVAHAGETRPIKADDEDGVVVYLSSFSKTVAPGLRVAWIAAPPALVEKIAIAKQSADLCTGSFDQRLVHELWSRGTLDREVPKLRAAYQGKRSAMELALRRELAGLVSWTTPRGGFFLWARFPDGIDTDALLQRAVAHGTLYVPGSAFYVEHRGSGHVRLSFSAPSRERIDEGISRLARAVREEMDGPGRRPTAAAGWQSE